jgi:hypothetical protein
MIKMIATTISNSISEKPFCLLLICLASLLEIGIARARRLYLQA